MCARLYEDSHRDPNLSCGGNFLEVYNGEARGVVPDGWNDEVSSIVVRAGCTLLAYEDGAFKGSDRSYQGVNHRLRNHDWNDVMSSYSCSCEFRPIDCRPTDGWELAVSCNARGHSVDSVCTYQLQEGVVIGRSVTRGGSVSSTVSSTITAEIGLTFEGAYNYSGISSSTTSSFTREYNWGTSSSVQKSLQTTRSVEMTAQPGQVTELDQIVGRCGDIVVYTEKYRIVSH